MTKISPQKMPKQGISKKNNGKNKKNGFCQKMRKQWILKKSFENIVKKKKNKKKQNSGFGQKTSQNKKTMPKQLNSGFCQKT